MASKNYLREWRERRGLTLEALAHEVELRAILRQIPPSSKSVPRTHASLSRWENGKSQMKEIGMELIAEAYGVDPEDLRKPPPEKTDPPRRRIEVREDQAHAVEAFVEAMERRATK